MHTRSFQRTGWSPHTDCFVNVLLSHCCVAITTKQHSRCFPGQESGHGLAESCSGSWIAMKASAWLCVVVGRILFPVPVGLRSPLSGWLSAVGCSEVTEPATPRQRSPGPSIMATHSQPAGSALKIVKVIHQITQTHSREAPLDSLKVKLIWALITPARTLHLYQRQTQSWGPHASCPQALPIFREGTFLGGVDPRGMEFGGSA